MCGYCCTGDRKNKVHFPLECKVEFIVIFTRDHQNSLPPTFGPLCTYRNSSDGESHRTRHCAGPRLGRIGYFDRYDNQPFSHKMPFLICPKLHLINQYSLPKYHPRSWLRHNRPSRPGHSALPTGSAPSPMANHLRRGHRLPPTLRPGVLSRPWICRLRFLNRKFYGLDGLCVGNSSTLLLASTTWLILTSFGLAHSVKGAHFLYIEFFFIRHQTSLSAFKHSD